MQFKILTLTLSSFIGWGISNDLICVTMGPSVPAKIIVSPSLKVPFIKIASMVVPCPGIALTLNGNIDINLFNQSFVFFFYQITDIFNIILN